MSLAMHPCPHCPAAFDSLKSLEHHLRAAHDDALPSEKFRCSTCDAEFMAQMEWLDHMRDEHDVDDAEPSAAVREKEATPGPSAS
jgi:uncharacterized C2H2 Zn-finger protein